MNAKRIQYQFTAMQFLLWFSWGTFGLFYIAYLENLGYSSKIIALGLILSTLCGIFAQYIWGYIGDVTSKIKGLFIIVLILLMASVTGFGFFVEQTVPMLIFVTFIGSTWLPLEALLDSWILSTEGLSTDKYSRIRSGGSLGFATMTLFFGRIVIQVGYPVIIVAFLITASLLLILAILTRTTSVKSPSHVHIGDVLRLFKNPSYVQILIFSILIFINHMCINNFYVYIFNDVGGNASHIGFAASAAAFTEIVGFLSIKYIQKFIRPILVFILVGILSFFRVYLLTEATTYVGIILTAIIQGAMFSVFLGTFKVYITKITPIRLLASAQTIAASTYFGIAAVISSFVGGLLIDDYGLPSFFLFMNIIATISVFYSLYIYYSDKKRNKAGTT